jgi:dTDP-4-dehydrorhamnose reductase
MILLLGSNGYVGSAFAKELTARDLQFAAPVRAECGNLADIKNVERLFESIRPSFVINAAGWPGTPNVDATAEFPVRCIESNLSIPSNLASVCAQQGIPLGHVSTGCIYFGTPLDAAGFTEEHAPNFGFASKDAGLYSRCKDLAEQCILRSGTKAWIWRLRMPFESLDGPRNFLSKLLRYPRLLEARNSISCLPEFAARGIDCLVHGIPYGIYNLTNPGALTTREITEHFARVGLLPPGGQWCFFASEEEFLGTVARVRRAACVLDTSKAENAGIGMRPIETALTETLAQWKPATR